MPKFTKSEIQQFYNNLFMTRNDNDQPVPAKNFCGIEAFRKMRGANKDYEGRFLFVPPTVINPEAELPLPAGDYTNIILSIYIDGDKIIELGAMTVQENVTLRDLFIFAKNNATGIETQTNKVAENKQTNTLSKNIIELDGKKYSFRQEDAFVEFYDGDMVIDNSNPELFERLKKAFLRRPSLV
jgi:hypothetical protein